MTWQRDEFEVTCEFARLDLAAIHEFLAHHSYWAQGISRELCERSLRGSLCFGLLHRDRQVGFARAVTDRATVAYLADVYVLPKFRGRGLGRWLVECIHAHPELQGLRRWVLVTHDAHGLYRQTGWQPLSHPERYMERLRPA